MRIVWRAMTPASPNNAPLFWFGLHNKPAHPHVLVPLRALSMVKGDVTLLPR